MNGIEFEFVSNGSGNFARLLGGEDIAEFSTLASCPDNTDPMRVQAASAADLDRSPCWSLAIDPLSNGYGWGVLQGFVYNVNWTWTPNAVLFLSDTDGEISEGDPVSAITQEIAVALTAQWIYFNPKCENINL